MRLNDMILVLWMLSFKPTVSLSSFTLIKRFFSLLFFVFFFFPGCRKGGVICISQVIDISPSNLDSSLCFTQLGISHDVLCIYGKENGSPLQYSYLENPVDGGAWWAAVHRIARSWTWLKRLSMNACIGEGNGNPLQYYCLENPRDRRAWWAAVFVVTQSWTRLKRHSSSSNSSILHIS